MTAGARTRAAGACSACLRRGWLLATLAGPLDFCSRDRERLFDALALDDQNLIHALGGRRRGELQRSYAALARERAPGSSEAPPLQPICRHHARFPDGLRFASGPRTLWATPDAARLCELARSPVVAVLGSGRASDYGLEVSRALGRGFAAAGVAVAVLARDGICAAALTGALEADGATLCVLPCGPDVSPPAVAASTRTRVVARGCLFGELPWGTPTRRWAQAACDRVAVGLSQLTIVVEADDDRRELAPARLAQALQRPLAAVPGRVTSTLSRGTNALLSAGAAMVRGPQDALELLGLDPPRPTPHTVARASLEPQLRLILEEVSGGRDTPDMLAGSARPLSAVLHALSELELRGLVVRGDGGRYLPCATAPAPDRHAGTDQYGLPRRAMAGPALRASMEAGGCDQSAP